MNGRQALPLLLSALVVAGGFLLEVRDDRVLVGGTALPPACLLRSTGLGDCPGCGLTRSVVLFCQLRWRESLALHPGGCLVLLAALMEIPYRLSRLLARKRGSGWGWIPGANRAMLSIALALAVGFWVSRGFCRWFS